MLLSRFSSYTTSSDTTFRGEAGLPAHVMILGCGRSGTSIFGELFDGLDSYVYRSEPPFGDVMAADLFNPTASKAPRESAEYPPPPGLSFPIAQYLSRFRGAAVFWIVRHPLDAVSSLRVGIEKNWGHHPRPPDWENWLDRPLLERCAHHWTYLNTVGFRHVEPYANVLHFEELIAEPLAFAHKVCRVVGTSPHSNSAHLQRWAARVQDTNTEAFIEAHTSRANSRPDHEKRVGRWRENLSLAEAAAVWPLVELTAARFGYARGRSSGAEVLD